MLKAIDVLADKIEARWRKDDYSVYSFANVAKSERDLLDITSLLSFSQLNSLLNLNALNKIQHSTTNSVRIFRVADEVI